MLATTLGKEETQMIINEELGEFIGRIPGQYTKRIGFDEKYIVLTTSSETSFYLDYEMFNVLKVSNPTEACVENYGHSLSEFQKDMRFERALELGWKLSEGKRVALLRTDVLLNILFEDLTQCCVMLEDVQIILDWMSKNK